MLKVIPCSVSYGTVFLVTVASEKMKLAIRQMCVSLGLKFVSP